MLVFRRSWPQKLALLSERGTGHQRGRRAHAQERHPRISHTNLKRIDQSKPRCLAVAEMPGPRLNLYPSGFYVCIAETSHLGASRYTEDLTEYLRRSARARGSSSGAAFRKPEQSTEANRCSADHALATCVNP
jgi:hypothetical protein